MTFSCVLAAVGSTQAPASAPTPVPYRVEAKLPDTLELLPPDAVKLTGYLGKRVENNEKNRLLRVDEDALLAGFRGRPGKQAWIGEHVGKWLHAATLAWVNTGDPALRRKLDRVVTELLKTQEPDGYLGTYVPAQRFGLYRGADWDVWVHKYNLIGLLTYHHYTGRADALAASRKIGDLLLKTFGPGKKSILAAGTHVGMASTSVLEPIVLLYRTTGDGRYLEFAKYLVRAWDEPNGPRVMSTLLAEKAVRKTANAKAYEMLSNLVGLCELARATGDRQYLQPAVHAWEDVVANHLYLTGSASHHEHFHEPHELPNAMAANVGETCVTVTWIQLNTQLLRLTGEARYADELERSYYNHLAAAQRPDGAHWCYYTALEGFKPYGPGINCCVSSGPRGMAMAPQLAYLRQRKPGVGPDTLVVNLFEASTATLPVGETQVTLEQRTLFPQAVGRGESFAGQSELTIRATRPVRFGLRFRAPAWARPLSVQIADRVSRPLPYDGWLVLPVRRWRDGDRLRVSFSVPVRLVAGSHGNAGRAALTYGPLVLALDGARNPRLPSPRALGLTDRSAVEISQQVAADSPVSFSAPVADAQGRVAPARLVPFAEAGSTGGRYAVWLRAPDAPLPKATSPFAFAEETRSRVGNVVGEIADGDPATFVVTFDNQPREEDWFAVERSEPLEIRRIVYAHGKTFHDGGWFDASAGKPRFEVRHEKDGPWFPVGTLEAYPATTAADSRGLKEGQLFTLRLREPVRAIAVRILGKPAHGDNPKQAFTSCAELQAYAD